MIVVFCILNCLVPIGRRKLHRTVEWITFFQVNWISVLIYCCYVIWQWYYYLKVYSWWHCRASKRHEISTETFSWYGAFINIGLVIRLKCCADLVNVHSSPVYHHISLKYKISVSRIKSTLTYIIRGTDGTLQYLIKALK